MDAVTSFIYGMSMMFFSMMAWMFWRKGSERLFRLIMLLMLIADAQCLKDSCSSITRGLTVRRDGISPPLSICLSFRSIALC